MERLNFEEITPYNAVEACIHLNRYAMVKTLCKDKRVLDAACGEGYGSYLIKKWGASEVYGIDIDEETIGKAKKMFNSSDVEFQCHTVEKLPFPDYYFDLIVSFETIEHLDRPEEFLKEIRRVLKPGGGILISCPNDPYYSTDATYSNPFHKRKYTYFDFKELVEEYLGNNVDYFLSFAVDGFLNMPISRSTEPSNAKHESMMEMLNYVECSHSLCVKQDRYINHWNSNYYVGVWGGNEIRKNISSVIYPREFFREIKDEDIELLRNIENWRSREEKKHLEVEEAIKVERLKTERFSSMLELLNKEIDCLQQNYDCLAYDHEEARKELEKLEHELNETGKKLQEVSMEKSYVDGELAGIKVSKGWKLLMMLYKIEGVFRG